MSPLIIYVRPRFTSMVSKDDFLDVASVLEDGDARSVILAMMDECDSDTVYRIFDLAVEYRRHTILSEFRVFLSTLEVETTEHVKSLERAGDEELVAFMIPSQISSSVEFFRNYLEIYDLLGRRTDIYDFLAQVLPIYEEVAESSMMYSEDYIAVTRRIARALGSNDPFDEIYACDPNLPKSYAPRLGDL